MTLKIHSVQHMASEDSPCATTIRPQRVPSYRTQSSMTDTTPPRYESLEREDNLVTLEAAQVDQKNPVARVKHDEPAPTIPTPATTRSSFHTPTSIAEAQPATPALSMDFEDPRLRSRSGATDAELLFWYCFPGFLNLSVGHLILNRAALPNSYPETWSDFQLHYFAGNFAAGLAQAMVLAMYLLGSLIVSIILRHDSWQAKRAYIGSFTAIGLLYTVAIISARIIISTAHGGFGNLTHEEAVAYIYEHVNLDYLKA